MNDSLLSAVLIAVGVLVAIGLICALILVIAAKFFAVKVDEKEQKIRACLPGANCGACGFTGCDGYAKALAEGSAPANLCVPGGASAAAQLGEVLGVSVEAASRRPNSIPALRGVGVCGGSGRVGVWCIAKIACSISAREAPWSAICCAFCTISFVIWGMIRVSERSSPLRRSFRVG